MSNLTKEQRHRNMQANKSKGTSIEILFGKLLWNAGVRYHKMIKTYLASLIFPLENIKLRFFVMGIFGMVKIGWFIKMTINRIVSFGTKK